MNTFPFNMVKGMAFKMAVGDSLSESWPEGRDNLPNGNDEVQVPESIHHILKMK